MCVPSSSMPVRLGRLGHRQHGVDDRDHLPGTDEGPDVLPGGRHYLGLFRVGPGPQRGGHDRGPLLHHQPQVNLAAAAAPGGDDRPGVPRWPARRGSRPGTDRP